MFLHSCREGNRAYGLLVNVLGNKHPTKIKLLCANQKSPFRELPREKPSANLPRTFFVDMSTSVHVCLSGKINRHSSVAGDTVPPIKNQESTSKKNETAL